jgi:hydroxymethylpyrimidine pyrophosphatase-like HAD family hydrolase
MAPGIEHDFRLASKANIHKDRLAVHGAERRHCPGFAIREQSPELVLGRQPNRLASCQIDEVREIHRVGRWHDGLNRLAVENTDHHFGPIAPAHVNGSGVFLGGKSGAVRNDRIGNLGLVQEPMDGSSDRHGASDWLKNQSEQGNCSTGEIEALFGDSAPADGANSGGTAGNPAFTAVKFSALALDYDGTIAIDGVFDPVVREAVADARRRGIAAILVTGRRLQDLQRVAGDLTCFDVVVAENGAVLEFPASGRHVRLAHAPPDIFIYELQRRGVPFSTGESLVEADARWAGTILEAVQALEQPLVLLFNRSRLMVLPQAVAKSTGLRQALLSLRLSPHNALAIGDAENDHDLLDACEVGVAVEWGSPALRAVADEVIAGTGPSAVAAYIRRIASHQRLSAAQMGRRHLFLGHELDGSPVDLAVRGRTILIAGEPGSGKSWLAGLLCEQLILQGYSVCIIDPEGDYRSLESLPSVMVLGGDDPPPRARELLRALRHPDVSLIVDLSKVPHQEKREYLQTLMPMLNVLRRRTGLPHKILLDEAHYFLGGPDGARFIDPELAGYILVTYRISALPPSIRAAGDAVVLVTEESDPDEIKTLFSLCRPKPPATASVDTFRNLQASEAVLLPGAEEAHGQVRRFRLAPRMTSHVRHRTKYLDMPVIDAHAFVFTVDGRAGPRVRTLKDFTDLLETLPADRLAGHLQRHDFSRWIDEVFRDHPLAAHLRQIEKRVGSEDARGVGLAVAQAIRARYQMAEPVLAFDERLHASS